MTIFELYEKLELQQPLVEKLEAVRAKMDFSAIEDALVLMLDRNTAYEAHQKIMEAFPEDEGSLHSMCCQLEVARRQYDKYMEMGISEDIFIDTMKAFTRFVGEHYVKYGEYVYDRDWWSYRQASMCLFRIGVLEYELYTFKGEKVLSIHIPSDANMKDENVGASIEMAKEFMAKFYPEYAGCKMYCESWLLAPKLQELLPETSNIVKFQKRFELFAEDYEDKGCVYWVFNSPKDTPFEQLPEKTSLQRKIKEVLLAGGGIGWGEGFIK